MCGSFKGSRVIESLLLFCCVSLLESFNMFLNISRQPQAVQDKFLEYHSLYPNEVVTDYMFPSVKNLKVFEKIKKLDLNKYQSVLLRRGHALGDIILTFPLMNYLRSLGKEVHINTNTRYVIRGVDCISGKPTYEYEDYDLILNLDGILEKDHRDKKLFEVNRVDIYNKFLNLKNIGNDWTINYPDIDVDLQGAIIGIQISGSKEKYKSVKLHPLMKELDKRGIKFYIIDDIASVYSYKNHVRIPTDVLGLLNIFKRLKGILCFDSGPLWLTHVTNTPAFVVVGPTSGKKIIVRHPNDKSVFYDTKKDFKCKKHGCGELAKDCNKQFSCLQNVNHERLITEFTIWMKRL